MSDDKLPNQIKQILDDSVNNLDAATLSRLNQARHKALENKSRWHSLKLQLPATALAAITVAVIVGSIWTIQSQQNNQIITNTNYEDLELISSNVEVDLLEEIDFVTWLVDADAG
jgi:Protein of unknown function (DUF3619)